jgi:hypothetical protein
MPKIRSWGARINEGQEPYSGDMYYGHGSWTILVIFGALFVVRALSSKRRRGGQRRPQASTSAFTGTHLGDPTGSPAAGSSGMGGRTFIGIAPGWLADPTGKHDQRYWSGTDWTEHVTDDGVPGTDPPPQPPNQQGAA